MLSRSSASAGYAEMACSMWSKQALASSIWPIPWWARVSRNQVSRLASLSSSRPSKIASESLASSSSSMMSLAVSNLNSKEGGAQPSRRWDSAPVPSLPSTSMPPPCSSWSPPHRLSGRTYHSDIECLSAALASSSLPPTSTRRDAFTCAGSGLWGELACASSSILAASSALPGCDDDDKNSGMFTIVSTVLQMAWHSCPRRSSAYWASSSSHAQARFSNSIPRLEYSRDSGPSTSWLRYMYFSWPAYGESSTARLKTATAWSICPTSARAVP
mmetsp:Transcript_10421/g.37014  ORF Transcript_10421/g.37014 Transcript_10421/m.37014 type:complete len:273 (-) Transcript_10421:193-1011(-)